MASTGMTSSVFCDEQTKRFFCSRKSWERVEHCHRFKLLIMYLNWRSLQIDELQEGQHCPHGKFPIYFYGIHERYAKLFHCFILCDGRICMLDTRLNMALIILTVIRAFCRACLDAKKVWEYEPNKEIFGTGQTNESFNEGLWEIENNPHVNFIGAVS